jgi:hypothetical protein
MPIKKNTHDQLKLDFGQKPIKQRKFPLEVLKKRLANWKKIKQAREEEEFYQSNINRLKKLFGKPTFKNYKTFIKKVEKEIVQENQMAISFARASDKEMQELHSTLAKHYTRYIKFLKDKAKTRTGQ